MSPDSALEAARRLFAGSRRAAAFTGAGVSTASGVPDFRSPGGVWARYQPVTIQEFVASADARRRYWQYKKEAFAHWSKAQPNAAHETLARLEAEGRMLGLITQNVDGLHQVAGSRNVLELHGSDRRVACLTCHKSWPTDEVQGWLAEGIDIPTCDACGGFLKPATVSFGQALPSRVLDEAFALAAAADLLLVLGSSLVVYPAAAIPEAAAEAGVAVLIVNREPTPLDRLARVVLHGSVEELLPAVCAA